MQIRRSNQRRRIVPLDDSINTLESREGSNVSIGPPPTEAPCTESKTEYSKRARRRFQLRTTDLIPKRAWSLAAVILLLLSIVFGIILVDGAAQGWRPVVGEQGVQSLTIGTNTSLSNWFSSFILILTALGCLQVYMLRQHRSDDYRGVYRWWLWMALILVFASLNVVTGVIDMGMTIVAHLFESTENFTVGWGWALVKFSILAVLISRFGFEMRFSRGAVAGCCVVFLLYTTALIVNTVELPAAFTDQYKMTYGNLLMLAKIGVFAVVLLYSRFIYLEAHGLVKRKARVDKVRATKPKKVKKPRSKTVKPSAKKTKPDDSDQEQTKSSPRKKTQPAAKKKSDASRTKPVAPRKKPAPQPIVEESVQLKAKPKSKTKSTARNNDHDLELQAEIEELESRTLSKSDRRRLKKLQRRQEQRQAA